MHTIPLSKRRPWVELPWGAGTLVDHHVMDTSLVAPASPSPRLHPIVIALTHFLTRKAQSHHPTFVP